MIVWALFDSGNGCYTQAFNQWCLDRQTDYKIYSIGIDVKGQKGTHIELDLASYKDLFGDNTMFIVLDGLPKPDLIIASPPCESWSVASSMFDGNASWIKGTTKIGQTRFIPRSRDQYNMLSAAGRKVQFKFKRSFLQRINGELTIYNTMRIIARYRPKVFIIENPKSSRIWEYISDFLCVKIPYSNNTIYSAYGYPVRKPTSFYSNIPLNLKTTCQGNTISWGKWAKDYNTRSNIPLNLIKDIFDTVENYIGVKV